MPSSRPLTLVTPAIMRHKLKKTARMGLKVAFCLALLDLLILLVGLLQIALTGETGHWAGFWRVQAEFLIWALP